MHGDSPESTGWAALIADVLGRPGGSPLLAALDAPMDPETVESLEYRRRFPPQGSTAQPSEPS